MPENKVDVTKMMSMITNVMAQLDISKLGKVGKIEKIKLVYKKQGNKLQMNIIHEPEDKYFNDQFIEIMKMVLGSDSKVPLGVKEID